MCLKCKERDVDAQYLGETSCSTYDRVIQHHRESRSKGGDEDKSHMRYHRDTYHPGEDMKDMCQIRVLKAHKSAFIRMISEAILIRKVY